MTLSQKHKTTLKHCNEPKLVWILLQQTDFYPYGLPKPKSIAPEVNPFKYSGKELYTDLLFTHYDFAARLQLPAFGLFQRPDPKASDFTWLNSYTFCGGDPVNNIDPDGNVVKSLDEESINNILNTLTIKEAEYVRFVNGVLDTNLLNECNSDSENMVALKTLANSDVSYIISTDSEARSKNEVLAFNENGIVGITLMPNAAEYSSPDNNVYIVTDGSLSAEHQVSNVAHEAYGHAYFYELKRQGHNVDPYHRYESVELPSEIDPETGLTVFVFGLVDTNIKLKEQISLVKSQAIQNYKSRKK